MLPDSALGVDREADVAAKVICNGRSGTKGQVPKDMLGRLRVLQTLWVERAEDVHSEESCLAAAAHYL